jgi:hypothetical protein
LGLIEDKVTLRYACGLSSDATSPSGQQKLGISKMVIQKTEDIAFYIGMTNGVLVKHVNENPHGPTYEEPPTIHDFVFTDSYRAAKAYDTLDTARKQQEKFNECIGRPILIVYRLEIKLVELINQE